MQSITSYITPFTYSKIKLNFKKSHKTKYDHVKQSRALMPNLIHSLDATSMSMLYHIFSRKYNNNPQFFSVHDCFGTTTDKVDILKTILASVYTDLYSSDHYLNKFDKDIFDTLKEKTDYVVDYKARTIDLGKTLYYIHDIEWVLNRKSQINHLNYIYCCRSILHK